jgi:hypothetical protein
MNQYKRGEIKNFKSLLGEYKNLNYINKPFNDKDTLTKWKSLGHVYEKYTGKMLDQSQTLPNWCFKFLDNFLLQNPTITLYCMTPGTILPEHSDTFLKYKHIMNLGLKDSISRCIIFLEDWKSGHYFEIDEDPIVKWKSGDYIMWRDSTSTYGSKFGKRE